MANVSAAFQPIWASNTNRLFGFEALARWSGSGKLDIAELLGWVQNTDLRVQLGARMITEAKRLHDAFYALGIDDLCFTVNISPEVLGHREGVESMLGQAKIANQDSPWLILEITESKENPTHALAAQNLMALRNRKIRIALDGFGLAHSGLVRAFDLNVDMLKLDGRLVRRLAAEQCGKAVLTHIAAIGRELSATTIAEGIETAEQHSTATDAGFDCLQGFLTGGPVNFEDALAIYA